MNFRTSLLIFLAAITMSCSTSKSEFIPEKIKKDTISFGSGGGFTGQVTKYYMTKDGKIYVQNADHIVKAGTISTSVSAQLFANYTNLNLDKLSLNEPGNKYYFIEMSSKNGKNVIKWGKSPLQNSNLETYIKY